MNHFNILSEAQAIRNEVTDKFPGYAPILNRIFFKMSNRMTRRLGHCKFRNGEAVEIALSFAAYRHDANHADLRNTVLHEIAHAIAGHRAGHGFAWQAVARTIGARPERCSNGLAVPAVEMSTIPCSICSGPIKCTSRQAAKARRGTVKYRHSTCKRSLKFS